MRQILRKILKSLLMPIENFIFFYIRLLPIGKLQKTVHIVRSDTIGDFVLFSAILPYFRKIYPNYKIVLIGDDVWQDLAFWVQKNRVVGSGQDYFDELIAVNGKHYNRNPFYYFNVLKKIRLSAPEIVIQPTFSRTKKSDGWALVSKESEKIAYEGDVSNIAVKTKAKNDKQYNRLIKNPISGLEPDRNMHFLNELAGHEVLNSGLPQWRLSQELMDSGRRFLALAGVDVKKPIMIICPNGSESDRTWTVENFVSLLLRLYNDNHLLQFVLIGGKRDSEKCLKIQELLAKEGLKAYNLCAKTRLSQLAEVLSVCALYIGAETGSGHMASAVGIPVIVLRWEGHYERFFPYPAWRTGCENAVVLQKRDKSDGIIRVQEAFNWAIKVLNLHNND